MARLHGRYARIAPALRSCCTRVTPVLHSRYARVELTFQSSHGVVLDESHQNGQTKE